MVSDLRVTLKQLEEQYRERLTELTTLREAIAAFSARYLARVGALHARRESLRKRLEQLAAARAAKQLKKKRHWAVKLVHPDFATDDRDLKRRHDATIKVNEAYGRGDLDGIIRAVEEYRNDASAEVVENSSDTAALRQKISKLRGLIDKINREIQNERASEAAWLKDQVEAAEARTEDALGNIAARFEREIAEAEREITEAESELSG